MTQHSPLTPQEYLEGVIEENRLLHKKLWAQRINQWKVNLCHLTAGVVIGASLMYIFGGC